VEAPLDHYEIITDRVAAICYYFHKEWVRFLSEIHLDSSGRISSLQNPD